MTSKTYKLSSNGLIRYVGVTKGSLDARLGQHLAEARKVKNTHKLNWLRSLEYPPTIELVEHTMPDDRDASERYWISMAREYGCRLVNGTDGGESGFSPTAETRAKLSAARRGKPFSPEHCAALSRAHIGKKNSPEAIAKTAAANTGTKRSLETCAKISASQHGKKRSLEARANMSAAAKKRIRHTYTPEHCAAISAGKKGKPISPITRAAQLLAITGKRHSSEHREAIRAGLQAHYAAIRREKGVNGR